MTPTARPFAATRIILGAMALGVLAITVVAAYLRATMEPSTDRSLARLLPLVLVGIALSEIPVFLVLRKVFAERARERRAESLELLKQGLLPLPLATFAILGAALAEGPGLFGAVILILGGPWIVLVAPLLSVALIAAQMPQRARLESLVRGG